MSSASRSRRTSDAAAKRPLRSVGTESTLAESYEEAAFDNAKPLDRETGTIPEGEEDELPASPTRKKRFSASEVDMPQDGMNAVDEGISQKSERIAQKVLEIQQKLENALAADRRTTTRKKPAESEDDVSETTAVRTRPVKPAKSATRPSSSKGRTRSGTASSSQTSTPAGRGEEDAVSYPRTVLIKAAEPAMRSSSDASRDEQSTPEPHPAAKATIPAAAAPAPVRAPTPTPAALDVRSTSRTRGAMVRSPVGTTDESDSDFQSAYSQESSPEDAEDAQSPLPSEDFGLFPKRSGPRDRVVSTATVGPRAGGAATPTSTTFSDDTAVSIAKK